MKHRNLMRNYYESRIDAVAAADPPDNLIQSAAISKRLYGRLGWEDLLGLLITAGYLLQLLLPGNWFSFGRFLFVFRFGF